MLTCHMLSVATTSALISRIDRSNENSEIHEIFKRHHENPKNSETSEMYKRHDENSKST